MISVKEMETELKLLIPKMETIEDMEGNNVMSIYLGSFMSLDPCGKYHHFISENGITQECEEYWENLDKAADNLGGWITSGEGDPTDIFFEKSTDE